MQPIHASINHIVFAGAAAGSSNAVRESDAKSDEHSHETVDNEEIEQAEKITKLESRDRAVRAHEQAHLSAAAGLAVSGPHFTFANGPDGKRYAIGGEVNIDISPVAGDPEATIRKAEQIRRAALAPADPSAQDQSVAASAAAMASKARAELLKQQQASEDEPTTTINLFV